MSSILSIDLGIKNLGWALLKVDSIKKSVTNVDFGIFIVDGKKSSKESVVSYRCGRLNEFFKMFKDEKLDYIIVERQVNNNTQAMCLMYAIVMHAMNVVEENRIFIFDPKLKFTFYHEEYCTKNKAHKKQSIERARKLICKDYSELTSKFDEFDKKDDISDAINQGITYLEMNNIISCDSRNDIKNKCNTDGDIGDNENDANKNDCGIGDKSIGNNSIGDKSIGDNKNDIKNNNDTDNNSIGDNDMENIDGE